MSWEKGNEELTVENLKKSFKDKLKSKEIGSKDDWKKKALQYLRYDNVKIVCKFVLFVTAHDTIPDQTVPGLMKIGKPGSYSYLEPNKWLADDFKSIEHIAPQKPQYNSIWDINLYENGDSQQIGNLTLLPKEVNSSAGNKGWLEKWIYYRHLSETDPDKLADLSEKAKNDGINLNKSTINLLKKTPYNHHIEPIVKLDPTGNWDKNFVEKRTERICDILWERMYEWLT